ncbi:MAG: response regulator [Chloroflexota bacterium]
MENASLLFICSDKLTLNFISKILREIGYRVLTATTGKEGSEIAWGQFPDIIIIDPDLSDIDGLKIALQIRQDKCTQHIPIIALSGEKSSEAVMTALEAGFSEYVPKDSKAINTLTEIIPNLLAKASQTPDDGLPPKQGIVITFISAKGGIGTSSLCANIADILAEIRPGKNIVVADLVLPIGSIAQIVGYTGSINLLSFTSLPSGQLTFQYLCDNLPLPEAWRFHLLASTPDPEAARQIEAEQVFATIGLLRQGFDFVFVDLGRSLSKISIPIILDSDRVVLVLSTDLSAVHITKTVLEHLVALGVERDTIIPLLNRAVGFEGLTKQEVEEFLGIGIAGTIPYMRENFTVANNLHLPLAYKFPNTTGTIALLGTVKYLDKHIQTGFRK